MAERESLLAEYQVCCDRIESSGARCWQSAAILVGAALAGAAFFGRLPHGKLSTLVISLFVGGAIIFVVCKLRSFFRREEWRHKVIYKRMREIEEELKLKVTWDVYYLDLLKDKPEEFNRLTQEDQTRYRDLRAAFPSPGPYGWRFLCILAWAGMVLWALLILAEVIFYLMYGSEFEVGNRWFHIGI